MPGIVRTVRVLLPVVLATTCFFGPCSARAFSEPNYRYFELVSIREKADATHTITVEGPDGKTWYREEQAILDLRDIVTMRAWPDESPVDDTHEVRLMVRDDSQLKLRRWTRDRIGQPIGVVSNGRLRYADKLYSELGPTVGIPGLKTLDEALRTCAAVQVEGDLEKVDGRLRILTLEHDQGMAALQRLREERAREGPKPEEFEIVSLRREPDKRHTQPIDAPDGEWWYRDPEAGLDMSHLAFLGGMRGGARGFKGVVKQSHVDHFRNWCQDRVGQFFGLVTDGELLHIDRIPGDLVDRFNRLAMVIEPAERLQAPERPEPQVEVSLREEYVHVRLVATDFVELVSIRKRMDVVHSVHVTDADGVTWYRDPTPGADMRRLAFDRAFVEYSAAERKATIRIPISDAGVADVQVWSASRVGDKIGVMLNGHIVWTGELDAKLTDSISIPTFHTLDRALPVCATIRVGGDEEAASLELARMLGRP